MFHDRRRNLGELKTLIVKNGHTDNVDRRPDCGRPHTARKTAEIAKAKDLAPIFLFTVFNPTRLCLLSENYAIDEIFSIRFTQSQ